MSTALTNYSSQLLSKDNPDVRRAFEQNYVEQVFKHYLALKVPADDIIKYFHKAQVTGADPLRDQIYLIPRQTKVKDGGQERWVTVGTIVFSYHFVETKAVESKEYDGYTIKTGVAKYFDPILAKEKDMLMSEATVTRKGKQYPFTAWWDEYVQTNSYGVTAQWKGKPHLMLEKCAKAGALRAAFPEWLSGAYTQEEMGAIEKDDEAIETTFKQEKEVEKHQAIEERIQSKLESAENVDQIEATMELIKKEMATLTDGSSVADKGKTMFEQLGVKKFEELKNKPLAELAVLLDKVKAVVTEKALRKTAPKPTGDSSTAINKGKPKE